MQPLGEQPHALHGDWIATIVTAGLGIATFVDDWSPAIIKLLTIVSLALMILRHALALRKGSP